MVASSGVRARAATRIEETPGTTRTGRSTARSTEELVSRDARVAHQGGRADLAVGHAVGERRERLRLVVVAARERGGVRHRSDHVEHRREADDDVGLGEQFARPARQVGGRSGADADGGDGRPGVGGLGGRRGLQGRGLLTHRSAVPRLAVSDIDGATVLTRSPTTVAVDKYLLGKSAVRNEMRRPTATADATETGAAGPGFGVATALAGGLLALALTLTGWRQ